MIQSRHVHLARRGAMLIAALAIAGCGAMSMSSRTTSMTARIAAENEVPPTASTGSGTLTASFDKDTNTLSWTVTYSGLTGPATAAHFHGPAVKGQNAGVVVPFTGSLASPIQGSAKLTDAQIGDLMAGKWYVNVHTEKNKGGEIRGQVMAN